MVTCKTMDTVPISKMNSTSSREPLSSNSSGFRLLDGDHLEAASSGSKNSVYKLKIDLMFDDTRSVFSKRLDDTRGSHRTRSIIMYGRSELASTVQSSRSITNLLQESTNATRKLATCTKKDVQRISNSVQEQIEQLFTDVAKDATSSFAVIYLGSLPLKDKVTSLQGLQKPLRELYLKESHTTIPGFLEICTTGLRVKSQNANTKNDESITPFHNIAVWSAVKFVVSDTDGGAAFLPLITDPENINKTSLFRPFCGYEKSQAPSSGHAPIFTVVMRSAGLPRVLKCHAFICKSTEDAIVIAATLYQSLMAHVNSSSYRSTKKRTPRNQNGVSCISIASSSVRTGSNCLSHSQALSNGRKSSLRSSSESFGADGTTPPRTGRKKRSSNTTLTSSNNIINEVETTTEERKRKSHKNKRAPPIPNGTNSANSVCHQSVRSTIGLKETICDSCGGGGHLPVVNSTGENSNSGMRSETNGDILTRVAIPRSGSFLNTGGLTRYKSRAARRHSGKIGGGGGSPLGFSELFNEFRLHENLHSLDEILYAIIDADGMSFNDLKPIYKEFLLKLAVTLTKDELFQRSKNIMRRQRKKKRQSNASIPQKKSKTLIFGTKSLKKVFHLGQFRSCRGKPVKLPRSKKAEDQNRFTHETENSRPSVLGRPHDQQQARIATSGSDVSLVRNDNTLRGLNRNSSSGYVADTTSYLSDYNDCNCSYVSCSECSYDSEACTCSSADRCYCSLRADHINRRLRRKNERNMVPAKSSTDISRQNKSSASGNKMNRDSLISCNSDEKCYCSMVEEESPIVVSGSDFGNTQSDTTWCDTDSCVSASKCYCQPKPHQASAAGGTAAEKLALDYELFTISGNSKSVQPHEALSVKKSLEAAAIFADVKLSQTTDIKSVCPPASVKSQKSFSSRNGRNLEAKRNAQPPKRRDSLSTDRRHKHPNPLTLSPRSSQRSHSADDLLGKVRTVERNSRSASGKSTRSKEQVQLVELEERRSFQNNYQSIPAANASLEDALGYLP